ncbi:MAG TPA: ABC transporter permease [Candidatus Acidoferrales bacterium]|nr:ABC transporter permease [Candidatus Acidoferrales bacterium]
MRRFLDSFGQVLAAMWSHKLRSFLTMFGIAWGVGSLLLLVGLGEGFRAGTEKALASFGEDYMQMYNGRVPALGSSQLSSRQYYLNYQDYLDIRKSPYVRNAAPVIYRGDLRLVSDYGNSNGYVDGSEPQFYNIRYQPVDQGRWPDWTDEAQRNNVCVIGSEFVRILFPGRPVIGARLLINGIPFEVIGTIKKIGHGNNNDQNMRLVMPYTTMATYFPMQGEGNANAVKYVAYQPVTRQQHDQARKAVRAIVARNHNFDPETPDAFDDWDSIENAEMMGKISDAMDAFLGAVGLVTLALGAMGVVNIMLVSVAERTREIGLRKALGATRRSILFQFFLEGLMLTGMSGAIGVAAAYGATRLFGLAPPIDGFELPHIYPATAALAMGSLATAGIVAGLYPARRAALLTPVEALRAE